MDDRWAFTNRSSMLDYQTAAALAAASRTLRGFNNGLADRSLASAVRSLEEADEAVKKPANDAGNPMSRFGRGMVLNTILQLYITTNEKKYATQFEELLWPALDRLLNFSITSALKQLAYIKSKSARQK